MLPFRRGFQSFARYLFRSVPCAHLHASLSLLSVSEMPNPGNRQRERSVEQNQRVQNIAAIKDGVVRMASCRAAALAFQILGSGTFHKGF